ncbi:MAG TPA: 3-phosphoserine/phosphohydroxythreonine transaminase [Chitinophagales bacterium]|nr:3-phosphoserine/phosphohydroxythreonine transaminase [Chitinophagales bacterium]
MKKYNFYSGPAILPPSVFEQASKAVMELDNIGLSLIEISHRSKEFTAVVEEAQQLVRDLTGLGDDYRILFLQGGATMQFCTIPYNMLDTNETAAYIEIGSWSKKAVKEAKLFGKVNVLASSADKNYSYIPKNYTVPSDAKYFHITTNETIHGSQLHQIPDSPVPLIADMSSDIFSRELDWKKFDMIYAGAQKNLGTSGATLVIMKESLLGKVTRPIPTILDYRSHIKDNSLHNTPSTFAIYVCMLTLRWLKEQGGLAKMEQRNRAKAALLYREIERNSLFEGNVAAEDRSMMNVTWIMPDPSLEEAFGQFAKDNGCIGIKGHRSVGGFRASIYNAMPDEGVTKLISVMQEFESKNNK